MKKICSSLLILSSAFASAQMPDTDIWIMDVVKAELDTIIFSKPLNITMRKGYDNQPAFSPDGTYLLYTSMRDEKQTDIFKYVFDDKSVSAFTNTATSEYSPTFMPDGKNISVVMVEPDSTQRLWKFPVKGGAPSLVMDKIDSIGYHCWINADSLALVMITHPLSLEVVNPKKQKPWKYSSAIGRCVLPAEDGKGFYYLEDHLATDSTWILRDSRWPKMTGLALPFISQDFCYYTDTDFPPVIIYGCNSVIWGFYKNTMETMCRFDVSGMGIKKITRMVMSADRKKVAFVAE